jgi:hypothetical protein
MLKLDLQSNKPNQYQAVVNRALSFFNLDTDGDEQMITPKVKKLRRSETPMSSIEMNMDKDDDISIQQKNTSVEETTEHNL